MYQAFLYFAFLAFCSAAPYGDLNSGRTLVNQPTTVVRVQQQDETDIVDTLGAGYSYFKKQPIVSRPLVQQRLAVSEQQVPITSFADTSNQWSDYTKASAFNQQPLQTQTFPSSSDLLVGGGGYGQQQQTATARANFMPQTFSSQQQGAFGSALSPFQPQATQTFVPQQQTFVPQQQTFVPQQQTFVPQQQQPITRNLGGSYGQQQQQQQDLQTFDSQQQTPVPQQQTFLPQQQQPITGNLGGSYGQQQQQDLPTVVPQQQPIIRNLGSSYGQQQQDVKTFVPQQQPIIRNLGSSYGQQQQDLQTFPQQQPTFVPQQQQTFVPQQQPLIRTLGNSYGQQQQLDQSTLSVQSNNAYGQQTQPTFTDLTSQGGYGQQVQQKLLPTTNTLNTGFGQQQSFGGSVPFVQPTLSQQTGFSHSNSLMTPSSRIVSQSQPLVTMADSGSYNGF